jgi:hypothetical protein
MTQEILITAAHGAGPGVAVATWLGPLAAGAITGAAALIAVLVTQRGERTRIHEDRLWKERATIYAEILAWANDVNAWALRRTPGPGEPLPARPLPLPRLQHARVVVFAGPAVRDSVETVDYELTCAPEPPEPAVQLHVDADALQDAVQQEIQFRHVRSARERRRMSIGHASLQNLLFGRGPRPRRPDPPTG